MCPVQSSGMSRDQLASVGRSSLLPLRLSPHPHRGRRTELLIDSRLAPIGWPRHRPSMIGVRLTYAPHIILDHALPTQPFASGLGTSIGYEQLRGGNTVSLVTHGSFFDDALAFRFESSELGWSANS